VQLGFRGTGMEQVVDEDVLARAVAATRLPAVIPPVPAGAAAMPGNWQNVQVLTDVGLAEFNRTMVAMTQWVSPQQGCNYCHVAGDFASDSLYTKVVARQMLRMTRAVNGQWSSHVGQTGVTCWTCHRGRSTPTRS
jgi:photosynthetic reaction center cytochrome c subunit